MKRKKSVFSILAVLVLSFSVVSGASASIPRDPVCSNEVTIFCGSTPKPPKCENGYCPLPTSLIPEVE